MKKIIMMPKISTRYSVCITVSRTAPTLLLFWVRRRPRLGKQRVVNDSERASSDADVLDYMIIYLSAVKVSPKRREEDAEWRRSLGRRTPREWRARRFRQGGCRGGSAAIDASINETVSCCKPTHSDLVTGSWQVFGMGRVLVLEQPDCARRMAIKWDN